VINPISIAWDPRGRLWVALTPGYPDKSEFTGRPARDEILILHDRNGDGRMDARTVFADGLDLVTSMVFHGDGVIVTQSPEILWLRDTDGDDRADQRVVLYSGFGYEDTHAVLSNMRWGLDGWIYLTQGYSGSGSLEVTGTHRFGHIPGGILRFRPDGSAIENLVSQHSNIWGLDLDWDDEVFFSLANNSHLRHLVVTDEVLAAGRLGDVEGWNEVVDHHHLNPIRSHDREPYQQIDYAGGFTSAVGDVIYDGGAWPKAYRGDHFVCEPTVNLVHRDALRRRGVSYVASRPRKSEFLASKDLWHRPVHLSVGPDGALYILDFYNLAVVHDDARGPEHGPTNAAIRPDRDHLHGRIWRAQHRKARRLPSALLDDHIAALEQSNAWQRRTAHRLLAAGPPRELDRLRRLVTEATQAPTRLHALWVLERWGQLDAPLLVRALGDAEPGVRKNAWRIAGLRPNGSLPGLAPALADERDARVRLVAMASAGRSIAALGPGTGGAVLLDLIDQLDDDWSRSALIHAFGERPEMLVEHGLIQSDVNRHRPYVAAGATLVGRSRDPALAGALFAAASRADASSELAGTSLTALQEAWPPDLFPAGLTSVAPALARLMASTDTALAMAALPFASRVGGDDLAAAVTQLTARLFDRVADPDAARAHRIGALRALLIMPEQRDRAIHDAARLLEKSAPRAVTLQAIAALGDQADPAVAEVLTAAFPDLSRGARKVAFELLMQRPAWTLRFLNAVATGTIARAAVGTDRGLKLLNHPDTAVARRAAEVLGKKKRIGAGQELVAELLPQLTGPGDVGAGRIVFEQNCSGCHLFRGSGTDFGPELTGMGARTTEALLPSIVDPNRVVDAGYQLHTATTTDGRALSGVLIRSTPDEIALRMINVDMVVRRDELVSLEATGESPMPTGLEQFIGADGLRNLLTYLRAGYESYHPIDLAPYATASTWHGLYDAAREPTRIAFTRYGSIDVDGIPFTILDPVRTASGFNAIVLKGGLKEDWDSKRRMPQRLDIQLGFQLRRVHVLGGIAAWGYPYRDEQAPAMSWTWHYRDGTSEQIVLHDGVEFADWIRRHDVPGSRFVPGLLQQGSPGQIRTFTLEPSRRDLVIERIELQSFDNHLAPTVLALTAQLAGATLGETLESGLEAVRAAAAAADDAEAVRLGRALFQPGLALSAQLELTHELGTLGVPIVAEILTEIFGDLLPEARTRAFEQLCGRTEWAHRLLNGIAAGRLASANLDDRMRNRLLEHSDSIVAARARAVLADPTAIDAASVTDPDYRPVDLASAYTASTAAGLYDPERSPQPLTLLDYGAIEALGVPYRMLEAERSLNGLNAIVLKGGMKDDWVSKARLPQRIEIPVGHALQRMHVLGGIAAWGFPFTDTGAPLVRWTWYYEDGQTEQRILHDGEQFADWIARNDVPGSRFIAGLVSPDSQGQVRAFSLDPNRRDAVVDRIVIESFDNHAAPTFLALTAQISGVSDWRWYLALAAALVAALAIAVWRRRARQRRYGVGRGGRDGGRDGGRAGGPTGRPGR